MALLAEPMEFLDLHHGSAVRISISAWTDGEASIAPKVPTARHVAIHMAQNELTSAPPPGHPITVVVPVLRVFMKRLDEPSPVPYYDISSKTLRAQMLPLLQSGIHRSKEFIISANGHAPLKRYSV